MVASGGGIEMLMQSPTAVGGDAVVGGAVPGADQMRAIGGVHARTLARTAAVPSC